jgi:voltage-gated potassium channel
MTKTLKKIISKLHRTVIGVEPPKGFLSAVSTLLILLIGGTTFYTQHEDWPIIDSFYFTVVTITTVGYGDLHPTTTLSKLVTIFLIFMGVGIGLFVISTLTDSYQRGREKRHHTIENWLHKLTDK